GAPAVSSSISSRFPKLTRPSSRESVMRATQSIWPRIWSAQSRTLHWPRMSHEGLHEPAELLSAATRNLPGALISLMEEREAVDWYQQRADACDDAALKAVMLHNRNEEVEHGMMTLEWIRRHDPTFD